MIIYGDKRSGNCYKIQLVCALLNIQHEWIDIDVMAGECQTAEFKKLNPNAKIPLLVLDNGETLSESNAILNYLATNSALLPVDSFQYAKMLQWQFFEQYSHEPYIAVARFIKLYQGLPDNRLQEYQSKHEPGYKALNVMEKQLENTEYLIASELTCADLSLYAYTHVAHEGGFSLQAYPKIQAWLRRISSINGYIKMN